MYVMESDSLITVKISGPLKTRTLAIVFIKGVSSAGIEFPNHESSTAISEARYKGDQLSLKKKKEKNSSGVT